MEILKQIAFNLFVQDSVPLGCAIRTEDWVCPALMEEHIRTPNLQAALLPSDNIFTQDPNGNRSSRHIFIKIPRENTKSIENFSELLKQIVNAWLAV